MPKCPSNIAFICLLAIETLCWHIDRKMEKSKIELADN